MNRILAARTVLLVALLGTILGAWHVYATRPAGRTVSRALWGLNLLHYSEFVGRLPGGTRRSLVEDDRADGDVARAVPPVPVPGTRFSDAPLVVRIEGTNRDADVRYTSDGSVPTRHSDRMDDAVSIEGSRVLRFKAFERDRRPSETVTATYVVGASHDLDVVSLVLDPVLLYDRHSGIYVHPLERGGAWERPARVEVLSPGSGITYASDVRLRIHGNASRRNPIRSFRLREPDAGTSLRERFGPRRERISRKQRHWVLRHVADGQIHRDRLALRIADQMGIPTSPVHPVVLHVNGRPFGVYDLMERVDREFVEGKDPGDDITLLRGGLAAPEAVVGDGQPWLDFLEFVRTGDLDDPRVWARIEREIDLDRCIDYWILQIFAADIDRPDSNMDIYRTSDSAPWRFLAWDFDGAFNYRGRFVDHDTLAWALRDRPRPDLKIVGSPDSPRHVRSTMLFRRLMSHPEFRSRFRTSFERLLDTTLATGNLLATFDEMLATYRDAREIERLRFPGDPPETADARIDEQVAMIREFLVRRPAVVRRLLAVHLGPAQ